MNKLYETKTKREIMNWKIDKLSLPPDRPWLISRKSLAPVNINVRPSIL
jgi:hypothetical protein